MMGKGLSIRLSKITVAARRRLASQNSSPPRLTGEFSLYGAPCQRLCRGLTWFACRHGSTRWRGPGSLQGMAYYSCSLPYYELVELRGLEPLASSVRLTRSPN